MAAKSLTKPKTSFSCRECGAQMKKWMGQCPDCEAWDSLIETVVPVNESGSRRFAGFATAQRVQALQEVEVGDTTRISSGIKELDRVLGGGFVPGSVVLLGGDPGIGKSTLLLQAMTALSRGDTGSMFYATGEESIEQIALRARRLCVDASPLQLLAENSVEAITGNAIQTKPSVLVADSIQTLYTEELQSAPGSVAQVRECAARLVRYAKQTNCTVILVGHVTKEGALAGPRALEHMVDCVLYFEGDRSSSFRLIRAIKNRFGAVNELGVFAMTEAGLKEVSNPSAMFINRHKTVPAGSVVLAAQEGTRPLLVEVQALVDQSALSNPRRLCVGMEQNRLAMLLAVLHRHGGYFLSDQDVFVNIVGGVRVMEPAADLAVALAVVSSLISKPVPAKTVIFGEVGLAGEVRPVQRGQERLKEAAKLGFTHALIPAANHQRSLGKNIRVRAVSRLNQAFDVFDES